MALWGCGTHSPQLADAGAGGETTSDAVIGADSAPASDGVKSALAVPRKHDFIGTFTPASGTWSLKMQRPGWVDPPASDLVFTFGGPGDTPLVGDWDGDGSETPGLWRDGVWHLANAWGSTADIVFPFGPSAGAAPVVGDWDGDGTTTIGVFDAGMFILRNSNDPASVSPAVVVSFGQPGDVPLAGDWDGDGVDTIGVYRPSNATFYLTNGLGAAPPIDVTLQYGDVGNVPIVGDWNEDGVSTVGVRAGTTFLLSNDLSSGLAEVGVDYGSATDVPLAGSWNAFASSGRSVAPAALKDFFLLGAWDQHSDSFQAWKDRGINTVVEVSEDIDTWTRAANDIGFMMIRRARPDPPTGPADNPDRNEPRLLAWLLYDEPEFGGADGLQLVTSERADWNQIDPARPAVTNFVGSLVANILDPADTLCNGPGDLTGNTSCYPDFLAQEEWVMQDFYPVAWSVPLSTIGQIGDSLTRWSSGKPQIFVIEAADILRDQPLSLTPDELREEIWDAIVHGARGVVYFPYMGCDPCLASDGVTPDVAAEMTAQNRTITALQSVLQGEINPGVVGLRAATPLEATWRVAGTKTYFFVLNTSPQSVTKTMAIKGSVAPDHLIEYQESRVVPVTATNQFADTFGPYGVHIYTTP